MPELQEKRKKKKTSVIAKQTVERKSRKKQLWAAKPLPLP